jgi:hypothetical protein
MAEFTWKDRLVKAATGPALFGVWWYFAPDYSSFFSTPLGQLTLANIVWHVVWLLLLVPCAFGSISLLYEAVTGRDSVWLWHPD